MTKHEKQLVVEVLRWEDGTLYSQIIDKNISPRIGNLVVVDRQKGRGLDAETVKRRAKAVSELLNIPYEEDFTWPCVAVQKRPCRCPKCIERGNV